MMVLGNIVAVTSIIAVVSLHPGHEHVRLRRDPVATSASARSRSTRSAFITDDEEERRAWRRNPDVTMLDAQSGRVVQRHASTAVMAEAGRERQHQLQRRAAREHPRARGVGGVRGVQRATRPTFGRLPSRSRSSAAQPVVLLGWDTADKLFKGSNPIDQVIQINGIHFRVVGVSEKKGSVFGNSQDEFVDDSARRVPAAVRIAPIAGAHGEAARHRTS